MTGIDEIYHGRYLSQKGPERIWGWNTPAGIIRARRRAKLIIESANLEPDQKVLEVGCGTGNFTAHFARTGAKILAVDISEDLLKIARKQKFLKNNVYFKRQRFEESDLDGPFDAIVGSSILHHLDVPLSINKIHSLLKLGGRISFAEPNFLNPQIFLQKSMPQLKKRLGDSPDEIAFIRWDLSKILKNSKFTDITILPFDWLHPHTPKGFIKFAKAAGSILENIPFLNEFSGSLLISARKI